MPAYSPPTRPLRILHLCGCFSKLSETFIYDLVKGLASDGFDNTVATYRRAREQSRPYDKVILVNPANGRSFEGLVRRAVMKAVRGDASEACWPIEQRRLSRVVRHVKPDLIHAHFGQIGVKIAPVAQRFGIPMVTTFHGFDATRLPRKPFWRFKLSELCKTERATVGVSENICSKIRELGAPEEATVKIANGVNLDQFPYQCPEERFDGRRVEWLFVGRLVEKKGTLYLLESFRKALEAIPSQFEPLLHIVGDGEEKEALVKACRRDGLQDRVIVHGEKPHRFVRDLMSRCHLHAQHSVTASDGDQEGQPVGLIEAAASGLPIVSTRHSGIPEVVVDDKNGFIVDERDTKTMGERMAYLTKHPERWRPMSEWGRRHVESNMRLQRQIKVWKQLYQDIVLGRCEVLSPKRAARDSRVRAVEHALS